MPGEILVFVTCPSAAADEVARPLVEEGLAACVNVVSGVRSVFSWKGEIEVASEDLLVIKSSRSVWEALRDRVKELHTYDVPEILCVPVEDGYKPYLDWLNSSLRL